jgi:glutamyl-tRNA reductase
MHTVNIRVTHQKADVPTIEAFAFPDVRRTLKDLAALPSVKECLILQTCNRVEIFAAAEDVDVAYHDILDYVMDKSITRMKKHFGPKADISHEQLMEHMINSSKRFHDVIEVEYHSAALHHLLRLTSGLESMIVGEDQILGQVRDAYHLAYGAHTIGPFFKNIFSKAIHVGKRTRTETKIDRGAVSIGSAAIELAESLFKELRGKTVLLIGAGEMGTLIAKSLKGLKVKKIISNRTLERSKKIARDVGGEILDFKNLQHGLKRADLVITATSAPRSIIKKGTVKAGMEGGKKELVIIDVSIPRNVDDEVGEVQGVKLYNIDGLKSIAEKNRRQREMEAIKVEGIIEEELSLLEKQLYHIDVEGIAKAIFGHAEDVRKREVEKARRMLGDGANEREMRILDDLTKVIISRTMSPLVGKIREAAETGDKDAIKAAEKWFLEHKKEA